MQTMIGLFNNKDAAENAVDKFRSLGFNTKGFSTGIQPAEEKDTSDINDSSEIMKRSATSTAIGAVLGGVTGLTIATAIPQFSNFMEQGSIAGTLGTSGVITATISGMLLGALVGAVISILTNLVHKAEESGHESEQAHKGAVFLAVPARKGEEHFVSHIFNEMGAYDIKSIEEPFTNASVEEVKEKTSETKKTFRPFSMDPGIYSAGVKGGSASNERDEQHQESEIKVYAKKGDVIHIEIDEK